MTSHMDVYGRLGTVTSIIKTRTIFHVVHKIMLAGQIRSSVYVTRQRRQGYSLLAMMNTQRIHRNVHVAWASVNRASIVM